MSNEHRYSHLTIQICRDAFAIDDIVHSMSTHRGRYWFKKNRTDTEPLLNRVRLMKTRMGEHMEMLSKMETILGDENNADRNTRNDR